MEESLFRELGAGARFTDERFREDRELFRQGRRRSSAATAVAATRIAPAPTLDFFGTGKAPGGGASKRKRRGSGSSSSTSVSSDDSSDDGDEAEAGSGSSHRQGADSDASSGGVAADAGAGSPGGDDSDGDGGRGNGAGSGLRMFRGSSTSGRRGKAAERTAARKARQIRVEEINALRRRLGIKVKGQAVPEPVATFDCDGFAGTMTSKRLRRTLLANIEASAYKEPTAVQMQALPALLSGRDVLACAPTGSGKTAAFLLPVLARLANNRPPRVAGELRRIHALVLAPTHELAQQTLREFDRLSAGMGIKAALLTKATAAGAGANAAALDVAEAGEASDSDSGSGSSSESDGEASQKRRAPRSRACLPFVDVLISTPLRLASMIEESDATTRQLADVQMVILDEADKLLEMGFVEQADTVLAACTNDKIVRGMFSATMASGIEELAHTALRDAVQVVVGKVGAGASDIDQKLLYVGREEGKLMAIRQQIREGMRPPVLIFLQSKERANELYSELKYDGVKAGILHGDMPLAAREDMVRRYRIGEVWFLIATDLIGRGLDFKGINTVINYDFPQTAVSYVHRIGRTGRAGRRGTAITYFTEDDVPRLRAIANVMRLSGCDVPAWMLSIKKLGRNAKRNLERYAPKRRPISTVAKYDRRKAAKKRRAVAASKAKKEKAHGSTTAAAASNGS